VLSYIDADADGMISFEEFEAFIIEYGLPLNAEEISLAYGRLDSESEGSLTQE
jgi:Ca2+-binding EF-hand superfamily protein